MTGSHEGACLVSARACPPIANVTRDDLVFPTGTMHQVSTLGSLSFSINSHGCLFTGRTSPPGM